jgi:putative hemolysin
MTMYRMFVIACCAVVALTGCGESSDDTETQTPNPASVFCEEQGGTVRIETAADGSQSGMCVLEDGTEIDEWEYYRANSTDATNG